MENRNMKFLAVNPDEIKATKKDGLWSVSDSGGNIIEGIPGEFSDDQIKICVELINDAYDKGVRFGWENKEKQIKRLLNLK